MTTRPAGAIRRAFSFAGHGGDAEHEARAACDGRPVEVRPTGAHLSVARLRSRALRA
jgi:hypothetical protein